VALHALRLIHAGPLWRDEAAVAGLASLPVRDILTWFPHEAFPPLFHLIVKTWAACFGGADRTFRLFGLLAGLALLAQIWWTTRRTLGTVPLLALALVAISPSFLLFGDSLRGYGLGSVAILAAFGAFARLALRPDRRALAGAAAAALLSVHLLLHNSPLLLALGLAAIGVGILRRRPRVIAAVAGIGAVTALSLLPYAGPIRAMRSWSVLVQVPVGPREILAEMARTASAPVDTLRWVWLLLLVLALVGAALALKRDAPGEEEATQPDLRLYSLLALPLAILAQWIFLATAGYTPRPWYFLPLLALAAVCLDGLLTASPLLRGTRLGAALLASLTLALPALAFTRERMSNMDLVADRIAAEAKPGDLVIVLPWYYGISYHRQDRGKAPWMTVPDLADHRMHRYDLVKARMEEPEPLRDVAEALERTLRSGHRVWVAGRVDFPPPGAQPLDLPPAPQSRAGWLEFAYVQVWSQQIGAFLRDHATHGGRAPIPSGPVSGFERLDLLVFSGWR